MGITPVLSIVGKKIPLCLSRDNLHFSRYLKMFCTSRENPKDVLWNSVWVTPLYVISICYSVRVWGRGEVWTGFWWGNLRDGDHWGDPDVDGRIILRLIFRKLEGVLGTGWSWLRIGTGGGHLWVR
jgi:hypothetical protein